LTSIAKLSRFSCFEEIRLPLENKLVACASLGLDRILYKKEVNSSERSHKEKGCFRLFNSLGRLIEAAAGGSKSRGRILSVRLTKERALYFQLGWDMAVSRFSLYAQV
jgi:hypothetical protein